MSKLQAAEKTFEFFFNRLVRGYKSITGREPQGLDLIKIRQEAKTKQIDANKIIEFPQPRSFGQEVDEMIKKGEVNIGTADKTPQYTPSKSQTDFELQEKFRANNEKAIKAFEDRNPNKKPKFYTGGMVDVEPSLDDIGHGSDALMARTRLMSPGAQATTSTGLNYLLAEDNDNMRIPFAGGGSDRMMSDAEKEERAYNLMRDSFDREQFLKERKRQMEMDKKRLEEKKYGVAVAQGGRIGYNKGKAVVKAVDKGRRGFMKAAGATTAGIAALKTGLLGFADKAAPVVEKVAETAGQAPAYFLNLVQKIKNLGTDVTEVLAYKSRQKVTKYKDYELTEDLTTGKQEIQRMKVLDDGSEAYYGQPLTEETYMSYKPGKGQIDETTKGKTPPDEYEEGTAYIRSDREYAGEVVEESATISDDVIEEGTKFEDNLSDFGKADGGRIGFESGKLVLGKNIYNLLKNNKKIKKAIDNIFGTGDYKLDADMAAESLVELNPKEFNNMLYEDLPDNLRSEIYGAVIGPIQNNALIASRAKKTANTINISDPKVAEDFTNFMKNHGDPAAQKGIKELEETLLLSNAKRTKGRKDNSAGGIQTMLGE